MDCENENQTTRTCQRDSCAPESVFEALVKRFGGDLERAKDYMTDAYCGEYPDVGWYAATFANDLYHEQMKSLPDFIRNHVDWDSVGEALLEHGAIFTIECDGVVPLCNGPAERPNKKKMCCP